jgi:uncharacterized coiled-coil protein SlyX
MISIMATETLPPPPLDLTLLGGNIAEITRDIRMLRLQVDIITGRLAGQDQRFTTIDQRFTGIDGRMAEIEKSIHGMLGEMSRGFGQQQQQLTRMEKRFDGVEATLADLGRTLGEQTKLLTDLLARG